MLTSEAEEVDQEEEKLLAFAIISGTASPRRHVDPDSEEQAGASPVHDAAPKVWVKKGCGAVLGLQWHHAGTGGGGGSGNGSGAATNFKKGPTWGSMCDRFPATRLPLAQEEIQLLPVETLPW